MTEAFASNGFSADEGLAGSVDPAPDVRALTNQQSHSWATLPNALDDITVSAEKAYETIM
jgi:hypothetical protein